MRLYDNTRLSAYKNCPRYYYYRHVRHWEPDGRKTALVFGGAWHSAMEAIWAAMCPPAVAPSKKTLCLLGYEAFLKHWIEEGMPPPDEIDYEVEREYAPRTPSQAMEMIIAYVDDRLRTIQDFEMIAVEKGFAVPLDPNNPDLFYIGKIDKIVRRRGKVLGIEHKTTTAYSKPNKFKAIFLDSFSPNAQVDGYLYALHLMFPGQVGGVWVDAALVHKSEEGFQYIPIERQLQHLDSWLWETLTWINAVENDTKHADAELASSPYMRAFPKNTNSCWNFMAACPYIGMCKAYSNPKDKPIPAGFTEKKWDPLQHLPPIEGISDANP
jgi:hypothetical protein